MIKGENSMVANFDRGIRYRQQKKQVEQIVRRIDKKRSMEIFIERSEGSMIQSHIQNKRKTQIKMQEQLKKNQKKANLHKRKTFSFNPIGQQIKSERRHATQSPQKLSDIIERQKHATILSHQKVQHQTMTVQNPIKNLQYQNVAFSIGGYMQSNNRNPHEFQYQNLKSIKSIYPKKLGIRPALEELQDYLQQQDPAILQRRRRIVQMLILCLMRRCHKKLYEALDIALETSTFFQDQEKEIILKSICLRLVGKIYKEISKLEEKKRISLQVKMSHEKSHKRLNKKRHSSFMIKTLASQRVFFTRFAHKYLKSKLLKQTSFLAQQTKFRESKDDRGSGTFDRINQRYQRSDHNLRSINEQNPTSKDEKIVTKMNKKLAIHLPTPKMLFSSKLKTQSQEQKVQQQPVLNYKIIIHQRDIESTNKLFPYEYPNCLDKFMGRKEYTFLISSINSLIFSETQCYNILQVFKEFITLIWGLVIVLMITILCLVDFDMSIPFDWIVVGFLIVLWFTLLVLFGKENLSNINVAGQRYQKMVCQLQKWNKKYKQMELIFKTTQSCQAIIICWPIGQNQSIQSGKSIQEADSINENSFTQSERSIDLKYEEYINEQNNYLLNQIDTQNADGDDKDQVIFPVQRLQKNLETKISGLEDEQINEKAAIHDEQDKSIKKKMTQSNLESVSKDSDSQSVDINFELFTPTIDSEITVPNLQTKLSQKIQLKQIHDIIQMSMDEKQQTQEKNEKRGRDEEQENCLELEAIENKEKKVYNFKYCLTEGESECQSVQQEVPNKIVQVQKQEYCVGNEDKLQQNKRFINGKESQERDGQKEDRVKKILEQEVLWKLVFQSEDEDQVIEPPY